MSIVNQSVTFQSLLQLMSLLTVLQAMKHHPIHIMSLHGVVVTVVAPEQDHPGIVQAAPATIARRLTTAEVPTIAAAVPVIQVAQAADVIKSVCLNYGYTSETQLAPLLVHNTTGFETVQEFIAAFIKLLEICDTHNIKWSSPQDGLWKLQQAVLDDTGYEFDERAEAEGWVFGDPNLGPWTMVYYAGRAMEEQTGYYIFSPDGKEEYVH
jgi:hypothetical protein